MAAVSGRHFLQIPGPSNVPDRILRAMDYPTIDHRGPDFLELSREIIDNIGQVFGTTQPVIIFPSSGTGAWEAALVNTLSAGDEVLLYETGHFAKIWAELATKLGLRLSVIESDWRAGVDADAIFERLQADTSHHIKAVAVVHNETSTAVTSRIGLVRDALNRADHPALLYLDTISSLGSTAVHHDDWGIDVTISGSQKGLMLPPGLGFNAISRKAVEATETATLPRSYWDWQSMLDANAKGVFPYTPATNLLYGLREALRMLSEEGLEQVFARHERHGKAARAAVQAWGLDLNCTEPADYSNVLTAVRMPEGHSADALRARILERYDMSLGNGLGRLNDIVFRIGHLGSFNDLMLIGTLGGIEMGLRLQDVPHQRGGVDAALTALASE